MFFCSGRAGLAALRNLAVLLYSLGPPLVRPATTHRADASSSGFTILPLYALHVFLVFPSKPVKRYSSFNGNIAESAIIGSAARATTLERYAARMMVKPPHDFIHPCRTNPCHDSGSSRTTSIPATIALPWPASLLCSK